MGCKYRVDMFFVVNWGMRGKICDDVMVYFVCKLVFCLYLERLYLRFSKLLYCNIELRF